MSYSGHLTDRCAPHTLECVSVNRLQTLSRQYRIRFARSPCVTVQDGRMGGSLLIAHCIALVYVRDSSTIAQASDQPGVVREGVVELFAPLPCIACAFGGLVGLLGRDTFRGELAGRLWGVFSRGGRYREAAEHVRALPRTMLVGVLVKLRAPRCATSGRTHELQRRRRSRRSVPLVFAFGSRCLLVGDRGQNPCRHSTHACLDGALACLGWRSECISPP